ncbi:MAG: DUF3737 family protein [Sphaerochaetaceae bacterium]|nr:DUF3737 family protein [Sphaerochaetaceae bacterium]
MSQKLVQGHYSGERALFKSKDIEIEYGVFSDGESPLKESHNISLYRTLFRWKYPLWYCSNVKAKECTWFDMARAGVWYSNDIEIVDTVIEAPKNFRRCTNLLLEKVYLPNAAETLWNCNKVTLKNVQAKGDYFAMGTNNIVAWNLDLDGNYSFDGSCNVEIHNSRLLSKDAFWNCENVTVYDSFISGEYIAWNSKNVRFVNCTIESLQGLCYVDNIVLENCHLVNTTLAFEYSTAIKAKVEGSIDSVFNPTDGIIEASGIDELIIDKNCLTPESTEIKAPCKTVSHRTPV